MTANVKGIDVAYPYQPDVFPVKNMGFVFVKATQGQAYVNPHQSQQIATVEKAKLVVGVYHFMQPGDSVMAQVNYFKTHAIVKPGYLIAVDWEGLNGAWPSNADKDALIKALKAAYPHNRVGLYTNKDGWLNHDHTSYCGDFLWIADITTAGKPRIQHAWTFHQYGSISLTDSEGKTHSFDADIANFATLDDLKKWAGYPATVPPTVTAPTQAYKDVLRNDVFPLPAGHADGDGNNALTVERVLVELYAMVKEIHDHVFGGPTP